MLKILKNFVIFSLLFAIFANFSLSNPKTPPAKTKFYNFDELLINGEYKKPQLLFIDSREKINFEKLLKLKKDFLPKLKSTQRDPVLR